MGKLHAVVAASMPVALSGSPYEVSTRSFAGVSGVLLYGSPLDVGLLQQVHLLQPFLRSGALRWGRVLLCKWSMVLQYASVLSSVACLPAACLRTWSCHCYSIRSLYRQCLRFASCRLLVWDLPERAEK